VSPISGVHPGAFGTGESLLGHHAFDELGHHLRVQRLIDDDFVFLFGSLARMNDPVGKVTAIGEENESFAFFVEAPDVMQILILQRQQIVDRHALMRIATGAKVALRLVQGENDRRLGAHRRTIDDHLVFRLHLRGEFLDDVAVDRHTTAEDDFLRATP